MAIKDEVVESPRTRIIFRQTAHDTQGRLLQFEQINPPHTPPIQGHQHVHQTEHFKVLSGTLGVKVGREERLLKDGEKITVLPGTFHSLWNAGQEPLHLAVELSPALEMETFFETIVGMERDGSMPEKGSLNLFKIIPVISEYGVYPLKAPIALQKVLLGGLAFVGRRLGYRAWYTEYSPNGPVRKSRQA